MTGGATEAAESGETISDTATHRHNPESTHVLLLMWVLLTRLRSCFTFHVERCGARGSAVVIFGLTVVDGGVLREDFDQQQRVLVGIMEELAFEARGQSLGVLVPEHLRLRNAAHLHREASRLSSLHRLGLHVAKDLRRLRDWKTPNRKGLVKQTTLAGSNMTLHLEHLSDNWES